MTEPAAKAIAGKVAAKKSASKLAGNNPSVNKTVSKSSKTSKAIKSTAKKTVVKGGRSYAPLQKPVKSVVTYRHVLAVEFILGIIVILVKPGQVSKDATTGELDKNTMSDLLQAASFIFV
ncbi:MAG: hypothetical protein ACREHG_01805, partial [Candidatus Saccharimonadales bacterium]